VYCKTKGLLQNESDIKKIAPVKKRDPDPLDHPLDQPLRCQKFKYTETIDFLMFE